MAHKVINIGSRNVDSSSFMLSQTPPNYDKKNFYIKGLQDKVNAEWPYRANRALIEYENH